MAKGKDVLTTGDVARICHVAPRTVSKWFDSGQLKGYRIPGSKDRRIPVSELIRFMKVHNMPTESLEVGKMRILMVAAPGEASSELAQSLRDKADYDVEVVSSNFETGVVAHKFAPHVLLLSLMAPNIDAGGICASIRNDEDLQTIKIVALANHLNDSEAHALLQQGYDGYVCDSANVSEVIKAIEETTAIIY